MEITISGVCRLIPDAGKYKSETRAAPMPQGSFPEQQKQHSDLSIEVLFFYTLKTE